MISGKCSAEQAAPVRVPVVEFVEAGSVVSVVSVEMSATPDTIDLTIHVTPVTRIGRALPDWPEALSLRPRLSRRCN